MYKYIFSLICLLSVALGASAQGYRYQNVIQGPRGPLANVPVAVCSQPATITSAPCSPLATLYTDSTLTTACNGTNGCSNPLTSDGYGNVLFYAAPGKYTIQYYGPQFSAPIAYQDIVLPCDPSNCNLTGRNVNSVRYVSVGNPQGWAGSDFGAWVNSAFADLPSTGGQIVVGTGSYGTSTTAISLGTVSKSAVLILPAGFNVTTSGQITVASGSSVLGSGGAITHPQTEIICNVGSSTDCLKTTNDYESQNYNNATVLENFLIECNSTGCRHGLSTPGTGIGMRVIGVNVDQTASACWDNTTDNTTFEWTEALYVQTVVLNKCGADGFDIDTSAGGFFNDSTFIGFQVRSQNGYFIKATSGATAATSIARLVFDNLHGIAGGITEPVNDGIFLTGGGTQNSISDWVFNGGEIEGHSQSGYIVNGAPSNGGTHFQFHGLGYDNFTGGYVSPNVSIDNYCGASTAGCVIGNSSLQLADTENNRGVNFALPSTGIIAPGVYYTLTVPGVSGTLCVTNSCALLTSTGAVATLTGTGACATNSTQKGGAWAGQATCTGTTGASTFIITPGTTAPNGWSCTASDLTTAANILRQSVSSTTACTIAGTVNANDVLTFTAVAY